MPADDPPAFETLPGRYYTDTQIFREELERFFFGSWIWAGRSEAITNPGDYFLQEVANESVVVVRGLGGEIRSFYNVCRHRGTRICTQQTGTFGGRIQCPYHGWTYALDGRLLGAPHMEASLNREDYPLHEIATATWDGHIFLNMSDQPEPLETHLGTLPTKFAAWHMEELRLHKQIRYDVRANWKLLIANYNECLHCPLIHPVLNQLTDYLGAENELDSQSYVGGGMGFRGNAETMSLDGRRRRDYLPGLSPEQRQRVEYYALYPNLLLSLHPDYMMMHTLWPKAVNQTEVVCEWYFDQAELKKPDFIADDAIAFWDRTNREDWEIVELSQLGIQSRAYTPGPYSRREELLHAFDQAVVTRERLPRE